MFVEVDPHDLKSNVKMLLSSLQLKTRETLLKRKWRHGKDVAFVAVLGNVLI